VLRSIWLLFVYLSFVGLSTTAPFVATLGYVWVDTFQPQAVAYIILNQLPVAMIMAIIALVTYVATDRRSPPPVSLETVLHVAIGLWVTVTMLWAEKPDAGWEKWDWAFKTIMFAAFVPYVIRSRVQIEAFAQTYVFSLAANFVPFGIKTLISGGGYGTNLGLQGGNSGLSEGGLLSTVCLMTVPLAIFLGKHGQLIPRWKLLPLAYWCIAGLSVATAIGTYERSALIGLIVLGIYMWIRTEHKLGFGLVGCVVGAIIVYTTSGAWNARISTIGDFSHEGSAQVRLAVWRWTMEYVASHPMGGGFMCFLINHIEIPGVNGAAPTIEFGRAFHSIYFEVLGEQGLPGFAMFLALAGISMFKLHRIAKRARANPDLHWVAGLADALQSGLAVFLSSGAFVGIAFQPMFWYFIAMSISLNAYMWRIEHGHGAAAVGWRPTASATPAGRGPQVAVGGWRGKAAGLTRRVATETGLGSRTV
jgi:putative inorganic carbon (HCO3(-)) transporter